MAEITKIKKGVIVECDCGATHKITIDDDKQIKTKSTFTRKKDEPTDDEKKRTSKKTESTEPDDDDDDEGIFF